MLALSVREAMEQAVSSLRAGHMTAGIDVGMHGGHSTDGKPNEQQYVFHYVFHTVRVVLPEASQYQAREEYTTLNEKVKQVSKLCSSLQYELEYSTLSSWTLHTVRLLGCTTH